MSAAPAKPRHLWENVNMTAFSANADNSSLKPVHLSRLRAIIPARGMPSFTARRSKSLLPNRIRIQALPQNGCSVGTPIYH